jgi:hypothetical protein
VVVRSAKARCGVDRLRQQQLVLVPGHRLLLPDLRPHHWPHDASHHCADDGAHQNAHHVPHHAAHEGANAAAHEDAHGERTIATRTRPLPALV